MSANPLKCVAGVATGALLMLAATGCGSNPPCETDLAAVDAARSAAKAAEMQLEDAKSQKAQLEQQIAAERARSGELEKQKAELEAQIRELQGK
ncbi:MAG: hypothetical protein R3B81_04240 [bacterium]